VCTAKSDKESKKGSQKRDTFTSKSKKKAKKKVSIDSEVEKKLKDISHFKNNHDE
jgi:hypothetical protein